MIKIKDVVVDYQRRVLQVEGFQKDGAETFVLARVCFSQDRVAVPQDRVAVPLSSVKKHKHPFFA